ncbi:hypothetical protein COX95_02840 [bacterium CG_4_10_14_0_2_um_filter_33_32]|nr:MAG: hypothetical protein AUJ93_02680 [bacterium CG2_30_33_46]PIR67965.1 MAG: hypothetical protein COU50_00385 [bacterium CG10_big_fil_rev_8_21_14_0_10_33_18]PIU77080.1 MAG: hypothetical protein COS74_00560 [bacterium CG06_land_8_20_14_3_00_33_50]PIW81177.1 MAG: hypothetical protein COZ97_03020 [bacterium CG_4_8_14_3_um_filter_33_28]PIY85030.1 MAG: hypothetical protein COY76_04170 [bacterium CG_4_10_14_0_8_um_filter_33_57]PIZ85780.1 MAG: hypothetical protein COX95_02840 [bacterium CG_4_10_1
MEVGDFQKRIAEFVVKWDKKRNNIPDEESTLIHLMEEVGELSREYVSKRMRKDKYSPDEVENAIGDIMIQLVKLAILRNLDIEKVVMKIIKSDEENRLLEE